MSPNNKGKVRVELILHSCTSCLFKYKLIKDNQMMVLFTHTCISIYGPHQASGHFVPDNTNFWSFFYPWKFNFIPSNSKGPRYDVIPKQRMSLTKKYQPLFGDCSARIYGYIILFVRSSVSQCQFMISIALEGVKSKIWPLGPFKFHWLWIHTIKIITLLQTVTYKICTCTTVLL